MTRIHNELGDTPNRAAFFVAVLALAKPDGSHLFFEGRCDGTLVWPPRGKGGHGYDPMFQPNGYSITFAEMEKDEKNKISHRAQALDMFLASLND